MLDQPGTGRGRNKCWKSIRLELARTPDYPEGSASRTYLLRLPLDEDSLIDERMLEHAPALATVHRYWPSEPDMFGYVIRTPQGWAISYEPGDDAGETVFPLETHPMREGDYIILSEPDGRPLQFRVASVGPMT